jgi:hypothetical protein
MRCLYGHNWRQRNRPYAVWQVSVVLWGESDIFLKVWHHFRCKTAKYVSSIYIPKEDLVANLFVT